VVKVFTPAPAEYPPLIALLASPPTMPDAFPIAAFKVLLLLIAPLREPAPVENIPPVKNKFLS